MWRFIPAPAGNSFYGRISEGIITVHPRACGEQSGQCCQSRRAYGSSPRLRGTVLQVGSHPGESRFIPAPAGNSDSAAGHPLRRPVHPRACGEQRAGIEFSTTFCGSSPRLRGTGKGSLICSWVIRFIPAPAGNRWELCCGTRRPPVHPRACGEQVTVRWRRLSIAGSSPRLRGTAVAWLCIRPFRRFIPAPAGNRECPHSPAVSFSVHPRACGEQNWKRTIAHCAHGSSPRLRGTVLGCLHDSRFIRFIPAPAGNSRCSCWHSLMSPVHPRACGEQSCGQCEAGKPAGSSPRLRGTALPILSRKAR